MEHITTLNMIKELAVRVMPKDGLLYLFGSRARGDYRQDSDWDILVLLNKDRVESADYTNISYPFTELGWEIDQYINPIIYSQSDWNKKSFTPFYKNVMNDKIVLFS